MNDFTCAGIKVECFNSWIPTSEAQFSFKKEGIFTGDTQIFNPHLEQYTYSDYSCVKICISFTSV